MAGNPIPDLQDDLLALAEDMADGCHNHEVAIGLVHVKEANVRASITALRNAEAAFGTAKNDRQAAMDVLQVADDAATEFLSSARRVLSNFLGNRWGAAWEPTGWPDQSTGMPRSQEKRMNLCASLKIYFTNVPTQEVAAMGVTAALADAKFEAISDARDALDMKEQAQTAAKQARDAALATLRETLRLLLGEIGTVLEDDDPRWHAFGLSMPSDPDTPEPVASLTLTPGTAGIVVARWPRAPRATRYRPFVQVVDVDPEFMARDPVHDLQVNLTGFTTGQTVKVYIIAANDAGQAMPGPTEEIVVP